jgi:SnoaL-like domain
VLVRYCRGIDRLDEQLVRTCYHPHAVDNHGLYDGSVDFFLSNAIRRQRGLELASHQIHNVLIEFAGDAAVSESYGTAVERARDSDGSLIDNIVGFRYVDRFERRSQGAWLIARRTVVIDWTRTELVDEGWLAKRDFRRGTRNTSDLILWRARALALTRMRRHRSAGRRSAPWCCFETGRSGCRCRGRGRGDHRLFVGRAAFKYRGRQQCAGVAALRSAEAQP